MRTLAGARRGRALSHREAAGGGQRGGSRAGQEPAVGSGVGAALRPLSYRERPSVARCASQGPSQAPQQEHLSEGARWARRMRLCYVLPFRILFKSTTESGNRGRFRTRALVVRPRFRADLQAAESSSSVTRAECCTSAAAAMRCGIGDRELEQTAISANSARTRLARKLRALERLRLAGARAE